MRVGDSYKIKSMTANGFTPEQICHRFRNSYGSEEVLKFIPEPPPPPPPAIEDEWLRNAVAERKVERTVKRKRRTKAQMERFREKQALEKMEKQGE